MGLFGFLVGVLACLILCVVLRFCWFDFWCLCLFILCFELGLFRFGYGSLLRLLGTAFWF